jgi:hypothetical protein
VQLILLYNVYQANEKDIQGCNCSQIIATKAVATKANMPEE